MRNESIDHIMSLVGDPNVRHAETWKEDGKTYIEIYAYSDEEGDYGYSGRVKTYQVPEEVFKAIALLKLQLTNKNSITGQKTDEVV